jgi:hypothetical protein
LGDSHISNVVIRCKTQGLGYTFVKFGELISSASPVGNDEYFVDGFPQASSGGIALSGLLGSIGRSDTIGV